MDRPLPLDDDARRDGDDDAIEVAAAAILDDGSVDVNDLLREAVRRAREAGHEVRGLVMTRRGARGGCAAQMLMVDVHSGDEYLVSQPMGSGSSSCRADPQGFARASAVLREALDAGADLVVCNRFGALEAEGQGFAAELLALMAQGVPLLTSINAQRLDAWKAFSAGAAVLPAQPQAVADWLAGTLPPRGIVLSN